MTLAAAEKFLVSFKLQRYIKKLNQERSEIINNALKNNIENLEVLNEINKKINDANEKLEKLIDIN